MCKLCSSVFVFSSYKSTKGAKFIVAYQYWVDMTFLCSLFQKYNLVCFFCLFVSFTLKNGTLHSHMFSFWRCQQHVISQRTTKCKWKQLQTHITTNHQHLYQKEKKETYIDHCIITMSYYFSNLYWPNISPTGINTNQRLICSSLCSCQYWLYCNKSLQLDSASPQPLALSQELS